MEEKKKNFALMELLLLIGQELDNKHIGVLYIIMNSHNCLREKVEERDGGWGQRSNEVE